MEQSKHAPYTWFVAVDGSESSNAAFQQCFNEFYDSNDKLIVGSITDQNKTYLSREYLPDSIYNKYRTFLLSHIHESKYRIVMQEKDLENNPKDEILQLANQNNATGIFVGYTGRKGVKAESTIIGSTTRHIALNTKLPLIIVKHLYSRDKCRTKGFTFLVCLDGSLKSEKGLEVCLKLASNPNDRIIGCLVEAPEIIEKIPTIREHFYDFLNKNKLNGDWVGLQMHNTTVSDEIINYVNTNEKHFVDFIVMGNSGRSAQLAGKEVLGSVAEKLVNSANANIVLLH